MSAVVATDEWPRRSLTVARFTPFSSRRLAWLWRTVWSDAPLGSFSVRQSLETVPDYSRSIPRQTTALTNDPSESFPPSCFFVGPLSVWWRMGTLAPCRCQPQAKPRQGGCRAWMPTNTSERPRAFRRPWRKAMVVVCVLAGRCFGASCRAFLKPKWTGNGTQITYANPLSCGPMFLKYENKSDRLRAGFDS